MFSLKFGAKILNEVGVGFCVEIIAVGRALRTLQMEVLRSELENSTCRTIQ